MDKNISKCKENKEKCVKIHKRKKKEKKKK